MRGEQDQRANDVVRATAVVALVAASTSLAKDGPHLPSCLRGYQVLTALAWPPLSDSSSGGTIVGVETVATPVGERHCTGTEVDLLLLPHEQRNDMSGPAFALAN